MMVFPFVMNMMVSDSVEGEILHSLTNDGVSSFKHIFGVAFR